MNKFQDYYKFLINLIVIMLCKTENLLMTMGELIKMHRDRLGLSQQGLAIRLGCSLQTISNVETKNTSTIQKYLWQGLVEVLGIPMDEIVASARASKDLKPIGNNLKIVSSSQDHSNPPSKPENAPESLLLRIAQSAGMSLQEFEKAFNRGNMKIIPAKITRKAAKTRRH